MKTLAADALQQHAFDLQSAVSKFSPGGKSKALGGSWKAGLPEDSSWQDVIREMESCFWSKPQALSEVQHGTSRLKTVLQSYVEASAEFDQDKDSELINTTEDALAEGQVTLTEE